MKLKLFDKCPKGYTFIMDGKTCSIVDIDEGNDFIMALFRQNEYVFGHVHNKNPHELLYLSEATHFVRTPTIEPDGVYVELAFLDGRHGIAAKAMHDLQPYTLGLATDKWSWFNVDCDLVNAKCIKCVHLYQDADVDIEAKPLNN